MAPAVCFLCQSFQLLLDQFDLGSARPGNNFFTAWCLPTPGLDNLLPTHRRLAIPFKKVMLACGTTGSGYQVAGVAELAWS